MEALLISTGLVAIAEIGDKTQLLAMLLAARYKKPLPIILGILVATVANHGLAASLGLMVTTWVGPEMMRWILGGSFLLMAAWILVPDKCDDGPCTSDRFGPFLATCIAFFLVEMGDKTQIATVALSARFADVLLVTMGTTLGMMLANVPAVMLGEVAARSLPMGLVRGGAAASFAVLGGLALLGPDLAIAG